MDLPCVPCSHPWRVFSPKGLPTRSRTRLAPPPRASLAAPSQRRAPRKENVAGEFFVDSTCIDCDTCRWMAPSTFSRAGHMSAVFHQPETEPERLQALQALLSCPTASIHTRTPPADIKATHHTFPLHVSSDLPCVFHCGFHSEKSFGATSYFVQTPGCNVLVDSPRFTPVLASRLEAMGGVDYLFLTHRDDVADHDRWGERLGCKRIMHNADVSWKTAGIEVKLEGDGPWDLPFPPDVNGDSGQSHSGLQIIHTPGHSPGSCCLLLRPMEGSVGALFTGDHLALDEDDETLSIFPEYNSMSVTLQAKSVRKLKDLPFLWLLPGHGRRFKFADQEHRMEALGSF